jgi:hypothetical protein
VSAPVFTWTAEGPHGDAGGMSGDPDGARQAAAEFLLTGQATSALVEEAVAEVGAVIPGGARQTEYRRTGEAWHATAPGAGDEIDWVPVSAEAGMR